MQCSVTDPQGTIREIPNVIAVKILDENDNPPFAQTTNNTVYVELESNLVNKVSGPFFRI